MHEQFRFGEVFLKIQRIHCREEKKKRIGRMDRVAGWMVPDEPGN